MSGDQQNLAARIKQLNCAFVCPQQLDGRTEHLFQPGMKLPFAPKSCACLTELFQRGCVACKLRFDRLQISKVSAAPRFALPERLPGIREISLRPIEEAFRIDDVLDIGQRAEPLFDFASVVPDRNAARLKCAITPVFGAPDTAFDAAKRP
ncbi:MAG TPA: hypothetical protein VKT99_08655 [Xanthobacteraceae bacterium]|nr:hypothetical protein [Xanthobacteraceae bacterium]